MVKAKVHEGSVSVAASASRSSHPAAPNAGNAGCAVFCGSTTVSPLKPAGISADDEATELPSASVIVRSTASESVAPSVVPLGIVVRDDHWINACLMASCVRR